MNFIVETLKSCVLFNNFNEKEILDILDNINYKKTPYKKGETIALEDDPISTIGIILSGSVEIQKNYPSGKTLTINHMHTGNIFGEVIIFSNRDTYPSTIVTLQDSQILFISKDNIIKLCTLNSVFLNNFMQLLSNRILTLSKGLKDISHQTIREKISNYLLNEYKKQNNLKIRVNYSRQEMADYFGIARPSLSRELVNMKKDGLIEFRKKTITILNLDSLEKSLF